MSLVEEQQGTYAAVIPKLSNRTAVALIACFFDKTRNQGYTVCGVPSDCRRQCGSWSLVDCEVGLHGPRSDDGAELRIRLSSESLGSQWTLLYISRAFEGKLGLHNRIIKVSQVRTCQG